MPISRDIGPLGRILFNNQYGFFRSIQSKITDVHGSMGRRDAMNNLQQSDLQRVDTQPSPPIKAT